MIYDNIYVNHSFSTSGALKDMRRLTVIIMLGLMKCKPNGVWIPHRRTIAQLENLRGLVFNYTGQNGMYDGCTADYLQKVTSWLHLGKMMDADLGQLLLLSITGHRKCPLYDDKCAHCSYSWWMHKFYPGTRCVMEQVI